MRTVNKMAKVALGLFAVAILAMMSAAEAVRRAGEYMKESGER